MLVLALSLSPIGGPSSPSLLRSLYPARSKSASSLSAGSIASSGASGLSGGNLPISRLSAAVLPGDTVILCSLPEGLTSTSMSRVSNTLTAGTSSASGLVIRIGSGGGGSNLLGSGGAGLLKLLLYRGFTLLVSTPSSDTLYLLTISKKLLLSRFCNSSLSTFFP